MASRRVIIGLILASLFILSACNIDTPDETSGGTIDCSPDALISAIEMANTTKEQVAINLAPNCLYEFSEAYNGELSRPFTALPSIASPILIHGNSATLQINYESRILLHLVYISDNGGLRINNLNLRATGLGSGWGTFGGLVYNMGTLEVHSSSLKDGLAVRGGIIANFGVLEVSSSSFGHSISQASNIVSYGGCIYNDGGDAVIDDTTFNACGGYVGGAIYSNHTSSGSLSISNSTFSQNHSGSFLGGGAIHSRGDLVITNSIFESNQSYVAGGAIDQGSGNLQITSSSFITNSAPKGGAVRFAGTIVAYSAVGTGLNIHNSDFIMNQATDHGAALFITSDPDSSVVLENNTVSQNFGPTAIYNSGPLLIRHNTIVFNDGKGVYTAPTHTEITIQDSIVANNVLDCDISRNLVPLGSNISSDYSCSGFSIIADPLLEPLANNGGPTMTHALPPSSPAVDAATGDCPVTDQRGEVRPGGNACDLGAYESGVASLGDTIIGDIPELDTSEPPDKGGPGPLPDLDICVARVEMLVPCNSGPGDDYPTINTLKPEGVVEVTGQSVNGEYAVIRNPCFPELGCWLRKSFLIFYCDDGALPLMSTPALAKPDSGKPSGGQPTCDPGASTQTACEASGGTWYTPPVGGAPYCKCN